MQVAQLWQYPVKSMVGVEVASAELAAHGMVRDRGWAVRDEERGGIRGAKKIGELMRFGARYVGDGGDVEIVAPTGEVIRSADPEANEHLTAALGHPVTLWPLQPGGSARPLPTRAS
ncbi:MAG: MOSC N-terminal beta barrel domain-containing protein [Ilumatobacteraceae bacterium]